MSTCRWNGAASPQMEGPSRSQAADIDERAWELGPGLGLDTSSSLEGAGAVTLRAW